MLHNESSCDKIKEKSGDPMQSRFYEYLKRIRKLRGFTQAQMAEQIGVSRSTYTNYENGNRTPDYAVLERIGDTLDCSLDDLFGRTGGRVSNSDRVCQPKISYGVSEHKEAEKEKTKYVRMEDVKPENLGNENPGTENRESEKAESPKAPEKKKIRRGPRLLIGAQSFRHMRERHVYCVDKTQFIEEFLDSYSQITLITRPRRFGKSLNMSMLAEFLDITKDSADVFAGTKIEESYWMDEMNQHPVIFLSFLNVSSENAESLCSKLKFIISREYQRYYEIVNDGKLPDAQRETFNDIYRELTGRKSQNNDRNSLANSIFVLCQTLNMYYDKLVYLLLDEYDTPFQNANANGFYGEVRAFLKDLFMSSLKGNPFLEKAVLTGVQRVAKENIFSGLNNLKVCTVKDREYEDCFGFTEEEVRELLAYCDVEFTDDVKWMYDGYRFGEAEVYNPWSICNYAGSKSKNLDYYWVNTSENSILRNALKQQGEGFGQKYEPLIRDGYTDVEVDFTMAYYEQTNEASLWGLFVNAGFLTIDRELGNGNYRLRVPNQEVWCVFRELTAAYVDVDRFRMNSLLWYLQKGELDQFAGEYQRILMEMPSYYDLKDENSYHMMMLGMCAFLRNDYRIESNRENGTGRSDICLYSKKKNAPNFVLEFKYTKNENEDLEVLAQKAIAQIQEKQYDAGMQGTVYDIGLAHFGKKTAVKYLKKE